LRFALIQNTGGIVDLVGGFQLELLCLDSKHGGDS